jgi:hypothetical protein
MKRNDIRAKLGNIEQLAGIREVRDAVANLRLIEAWNGRLRFAVLADQGFDIGPLSLDGKNRVFLAKGGLAHRTEGDILGGLFFTCGPDNAGPAEGKLPMHGSFRTTPATSISTRAEWVRDAYRLTICGEVRYASLFGGNIVLRRTIETEYDSTELTVTDTVVNEGFTPRPLMLLYHINAGYPLLDEGVEIRLPECVSCLREAKQQPVPDSTWNRMPAPASSAPEKVFYHEGICGQAQLQVYNPVNGMGMAVSYDAAQLPVLTQWISPMAGDYALGLEPGNCHVESLSGESQWNGVEVLESGASKQVNIRFTFC